MKLGMNINHSESVLTNMIDAQNCMVGAVVEGIVRHRYIFKSFWYVRTIFLKFLHQNIICCSLFGCLKRPKILRQMQSKLLQYEQEKCETAF